MRNLVSIILISGFLFVVGCPPPLAPVPAPLRRQEALAHYNSQVESIPPFRAGIAEWELQFYDRDEHKHHFKELFGKIFYRPPVRAERPAKFYLEASAPLQKGWVVGSNETEYWMYSPWGGGMGYWGKYAHYGQDCASLVPMHPQVLLEFAGLLPVPVRPPYPLYKVRTETYILEYIVLQDEGYSSKREIIVDRRSNLPREINAYDADGLLSMHSELSAYKPLAQAVLPTEIFLSFPQEDSFLRLKISSYKLDAKKREPLFRRPARVSGITDYQQIDKDCEHE